MATLEFLANVHISVCYQLTFVFTGYYVYLADELAASQNSLHFTKDFFTVTQKTRDKGNVAHNCHGKSKSLTAKANSLTAKANQLNAIFFIAEVSLFCFDRNVGTLHRRASIYTHTTSR